MNRQARRNLAREAKLQFQDWDINLSLYSVEIVHEPKSVTCKIVLTHKVNGVTLCLNDVFFTDDGRILQCVHSFR